MSPPLSLLSRSAFEPSAEQLAAILAPGSVAVRAGAGSGKTEVLARRFAALVAGDVSGIEAMMPSEIAALTFTDKATRDMRARIRLVLEEQAAIAAHPHRRNHLARALRMLPLARISTIHAFCSRLLAENPIEARVPPAFEVLDQYQSQAFIERHAHDLILERLRSRDPGALHLVRVRGLRGSRFRLGAVELIVSLAGRLQRFGRDARWLLDATAATCLEIEGCESEVAQMAAELAGLVDRLLALRGLPETASRKIEELRVRWPAIRRSLAAFSSASDPAQLEPLRALVRSLPAAQAGAVKPIVRRIGELVRQSDSRVGLGGQLIELYGAVRAAPVMDQNARMLASVIDQIEQRRESEGVMTFDDLLIRARRLLTGHPGVAARYRVQLRALLVDEYQDTDPIQGEIVRLLTEPRPDSPAPILFVVGDEKQSIYRFRGADVTVFKRVQAIVDRMEPLKINRRAGPNLIAFCNGLSAAVLRAETARPADFWVEWDASHKLEPLRPQAESAQPSVEVLLMSAGRGTRREEEAAAIASRILALIGATIVVDRGTGHARAARFGDVCVLMRSFEDLRIYERALGAAGIPLYVVRGRGFFERIEILDVIEMLSAVYDVRDEIALAATLRSPFFMLSDDCLIEIALKAECEHSSIARLFQCDESPFADLAVDSSRAELSRRTLRELRAIRGSRPLSAILEHAFEVTHFHAVMAGQIDGLQRLANLRKLEAMVREFESRELHYDLVTYLRRLAAQAPLEPQAPLFDDTQDVVRLMTIHQAKGLEFPVVVVADLGRMPPVEDRNYLLSPEQGLLIAETIGSGEDELPNRYLSEYRALLGEQERAESARLLYVAITRARDHLVLSAGSGNGPWRKKLFGYLGPAAMSFASSGREQEQIWVDDALIVLRRADSVARSEKSPAAAIASDPVLEQLAERRINFRPAPPAEITTTPTALADFERCPRQYRLRHLMQIPEGNAAMSTGGRALEKGVVAHTALQAVDLRLRGNQLRQSIAEIVSARGREAMLPPQDLEAIADDLTRYVSRVDGSEQVVGREIPFFIALEDQNFTLFLNGQLDLLARQNGALRVRDYKYARFEAGRADDYRWQMEAYALAARAAYPGEQVEAELVFLRDETVQHKISLAQPELTRRNLLELGRAMAVAESTSEYPMKPAAPAECSRLGCGYVAICWPRVAG